MRIATHLRFCSRCVVLWLPASFALSCGADTFPDRPIHLIVPYAPGGSLDYLGRLITTKLAADLHQTVIVDNRPGAGGVTGTNDLARASPDGYTIGIAAPASQTTAVAMRRKIPYDPLKDFTPLSLLAKNVMTVAVPPFSPIQDLRQLVAYAKAHPGQLSFASAGVGTSEHLNGEMLNQFAGIDLQHVAYRGAAPALQDLLSGNVQVGYLSISTALPLAKAGKVRLIAVLDEQRYPALPPVPTAKEQLAGFEPRVSWISAFAPAGLPDELANWWNARLVSAVNSPAVRDKLDANGLLAVGSTRKSLEAMLKSDIAAWTPIVRAAKIPPE